MLGRKKANVTREFIGILSHTRVLTFFELSTYFAEKMQRWLRLLLLNMVLRHVLQARVKRLGGGTQYGNRTSRMLLKLAWWLLSAAWGKP